MKDFGKLLGRIRQYKGYAFLNMLCNVLSVFFSVFSVTMIMPFLGLLLGTIEPVETLPAPSLSASYFINLFMHYLTGIISSAGGKPLALVFICTLVVTSFFLKNLFRYLAMYFLAPIRSGVVRDLRSELHARILALPLSWYSGTRKGDLMARLSNDVQEVEWSILSSLEVMAKDPLTIVAFLTGMIFINPQLTLTAFIIIPIAGFIIGSVGRSLKRTSVKTQRQMGLLLSAVEETISGLRIIKAFNAERKISHKFEDLNRGYFRLMKRTYRKRDLASPLSELLGVGALVVVIYYGGNLVLSDALGADKLITFVAFFSQIIAPSKAFTSAWYNIQKGMASVERIGAVLQADQKIRERPGAKAIASFGNAIEYRNVSFAYGTEKVLDGISLTIPRGATVALVGRSGAGKTTLADMLPRFYDPDEGAVLIDGKPISDLQIASLRSLMGVVSQESILFNDTVFENIALGVTQCSEEDVVAAARVANAHDFIMNMEDGYQSNIGDRGSKLSGGQRQRLSIARAVLKNPPILILDEATSSLDSESERLVQEALVNLMKNRTSIVIAHRLSTIQHADLIVVMHEGKIVEQGKHEELMEKNGTYRKLYELQYFD